MTRLDRLTAILTHLQSKRSINADELAKRFEVSIRTIYRDVKSLMEAGVPIIGEAGVGYSLVEGYRLPPVMFNREEALSLLMAEKFISKLTDRHNSQQFASAMVKIKAVLKTTERDFLEGIEENVTVIKVNEPHHENSQPNAIQTALVALADKKVLDLMYSSYDQQQPTRRHIEPVGLYHSHGYWYLIAYCRLRQEYRNFRLDRIKHLSITPEVFHKHHPTLSEYLASIQRSENLTKVVIWITKNQARFMGEQKYRNGFIEETDKGDWMEMTFMISHHEWFVRWLLMMADEVKVISPLEIKEKLIETLGEMLILQKKY